ncbi:MAG: hypothetical protein MI919_28965, partial [Holophagales bacterium]|nr:hypothetical protein [Holophagales bacterium]
MNDLLIPGGAEGDGGTDREATSGGPPPVAGPPISERREPAVEVHDLTVAYHTQPVLWDVDLELPEGKLIAIVGP